MVDVASVMSRRDGHRRIDGGRFTHVNPKWIEEVECVEAGKVQIRDITLENRGAGDPGLINPFPGDVTERSTLFDPGEVA